MRFRSWAIVFVGFAVAACSTAEVSDDDDDGSGAGGPGSGGAGAGSSGNGGSGGDQPPPCQGTHFTGQPARWSIPFAADSTWDPGSTVDWTVMDVDGDGYIDLLNASPNFSTDPSVGTTHWEFFKGSVTGFATAPARWSIPFPADSTWDPGSTVDWTVMDVDGDGYIDLLNASPNFSTDPSVGTTHWEFFKGSATGFATTPARWSIPFPADSTWDPGSTVDWTVMDVDGDGYIDLLNASPNFSTDPSVGTTHWELFKGGDNGFAPTASRWTIPFAADSVRDPGSTVDWTTIDVDGDGVVDLLNASPNFSTDATVGSTHWEWFPGGTDGFATAPTRFAIPFPATTTWDPGSTVEWTILDVDGDGFIDIFNASPNFSGDPSVGTSHWEFFKGSASGFGPASAWGIPFPADATWDPGTTVEWTILDADGDGIVDLLNASPNFSADAAVGATHWEWFVGACDGS